MGVDKTIVKQDRAHIEIERGDGITRCIRLDTERGHASTLRSQKPKVHHGDGAYGSMPLPRTDKLNIVERVGFA